MRNKATPRVAIIGAGFSEVVLGQELQKSEEVRIFEKARGCGGRMSTRCIADFAFDHGLQCFSAHRKSGDGIIIFLMLNLISILSPDFLAYN